MTMQHVDMLINARWIAPVEPAGVVHENWALAVRNGRIVALLPGDQASQQYTADDVFDRPGHLVIPGLINAHTHAPMTLMRGLADDMPLMEWLHQHIWPVEQRWMSPDFVRDGTLLAVAEMLRGGVTCFNDMYFFPDIVAQTAAHAGMRVCAGIIVVDFPTVWAQSSDEYITKGLALHDEYKRDPLIKFVFAPHAPYSVSDASLTRIRKLSDQLYLPVHMHLHETADEIRKSIEQTGKRPFARLEEIGLLNYLLVAVHMTQVTDDEINHVANSAVSVVHCPESNLKLASGFCPVEKFLAAGVNVALGTDGAASNNDLDLLGEMRTAALLGKAVAGDPGKLDAQQALRMATINGARALGLADDIGSLEPDKWADITCVDLERLNTQPVYDPVSQLLYAAGRDQVSDVWVAGRQLVADGELVRLDAGQIMSKAVEWQHRIRDTDLSQAKSAP